MRKVKSKKDDYTVECKSQSETADVLNYIYDNNECSWLHWKYVSKFKDNKGNQNDDINDSIPERLNHLPVISFETWQGLPDEEPKDFVLPEKWCVQWNKEVGKYFAERSDKCYNDSWDYLKNINNSNQNILDYSDKPLVASFSHFGNNTYYTEITFEQFKEHVLKERKIVGYKLVKEEYKKAVKAIINREDWFHNFDINLKEKGFNFAYTDEKGSVHSNIKKSGVLDLWFEPVFEKETIKLKSGIELSESDIEEVKEILKNKTESFTF